MECTAAAGVQDFEIITRHKGGLQWLAHADAYSVARAFVKGEIEVQGDFIAGARFSMPCAAGIRGDSPSAGPAGKPPRATSASITTVPTISTSFFWTRGWY